MLEINHTARVQGVKTYEEFINVDMFLLRSLTLPEYNKVKMTQRAITFE